ncbi:hypothetical protein Tco_0630617 [Tanacetum coccineum]
MSTSHTSITSRTRPFIPYIILADSEDEDATQSVIFTLLSSDHVPASSGYSPNFDSDFEPTKDDSSDKDLIKTDEPLQAQTALTPLVQPPPTRPLPTISALVLRPGQEIPLRRPYRLHPDGPLMMRTPRKRVRTPVSLPPAIEAAIAEEIDAPPRKRDKLSPPSPSRNRSRLSSPPLPPLLSSLMMSLGRNLEEIHVTWALFWKKQDKSTTLHKRRLEELLTEGIPIEVEPLDETQLDDLGLNTCNHDIPLSSREVPSFDELEPQPKPLPNCPYLNPCIDDPKKHYGFKPGLLGQSGSLGVEFSNLEMIENDWEIESKEVSFLGRGLNSPIRPKEVEKIRIKETHHLEHIIQQPIFQHVTSSHNNGVYR